MEYIIQTRNLYKRYSGKYAVNNVTINVRKGEIYGLIGKNGAGKTTLMRLILGLANPTKGEIVLFEGENLHAAREKIGSLIEEPGLFKGCTAYENMRRFCMLFGADPSEIKPLLEKVGLADTGYKKAGQFSLGMRQRLGIAIALLKHPDVLVLDEPINGLDPAGIKEIRDMILSLNEEGVTFIISSHLLDELAKVVTRYGILADGKVVEEISSAELEDRCQKYIRIACSDPEKAAFALTAKFQGIALEATETGLRLNSHHDQIAEINAFLVQTGFAVSEISHSAGGFEEFFIERLQ